MLILLSGPKNAGKTTVAKLLKQDMAALKIVEVDDYFFRFPNMHPCEASAYCLRLACDRAEGLMDAGYHAIIPYPFTQNDVRMVRSRFKEQLNDPFLFTLSMPIHIVQRRQRNRRLTEEEWVCVRMSYRLHVHAPHIGVVIDTAISSPEKTAKIIRSYISRNENTASMC